MNVINVTIGKLLQIYNNSLDFKTISTYIRIIMLIISPLLTIIYKKFKFLKSSLLIVENEKKDLVKFNQNFYIFIFVFLSFALNLLVVFGYIYIVLQFLNFDLTNINDIFLRKSILILIIILPLIIIIILNCLLIKCIKKQGFYKDFLLINKYTNFIFSFMNYIFLLISILSIIIFKSDFLFNALYYIWIILVVCVCVLPTIERFKKTTQVKIYLNEITINAQSPIKQTNNIIYYFDLNNKYEFLKKNVFRIEYDINISKLYNWKKGNGNITVYDNNYSLDFNYYKTFKKNWIKIIKLDNDQNKYIINIINLEYIQNLYFISEKNTIKKDCGEFYKKILG